MRSRDIAAGSTEGTMTEWLLIGGVLLAVAIAVVTPTAILHWQVRRRARE